MALLPRQLVLRGVLADHQELVSRPTLVVVAADVVDCVVDIVGDADTSGNGTGDIGRHVDGLGGGAETDGDGLGDDSEEGGGAELDEGQSGGGGESGLLEGRHLEGFWGWSAGGSGECVGVKGGRRRLNES